MARPQIVSMDPYTATLPYLQLSLLTTGNMLNLYNFNVQWMCLKDVMHVCKLKENTSIDFFQYCEKNLILTAHIELKWMDPNSQTTRTAASALLPAITKKCFE